MALTNSNTFPKNALEKLHSDGLSQVSDKSGLRASPAAPTQGWRDEQGPWNLILPLFSTPSLSNAALFGKRGEVGQFCTLFPNLHIFLLAHKAALVLSLNTEVTPTPWLQKMHWFALLKKNHWIQKMLFSALLENERAGKRSQWDSQGNIYRIFTPLVFVGGGWAVLGWGGTHLPCTPGGRLWHKLWAWADPVFFFSLEMCFLCPGPISSFCPQDVLGWGKISSNPTRCSEGCWVFSSQILGFLISIPKDQ